jgi:crotonobetaine/carnitine-CoA ligase
MNHRLLPQLIAHRAQECPDRIYIQHVDGATLTFGQLHDAALRWAAAYLSAGVQCGDRVLTMLPLNLDFYSSALGLAWLLGVEAPVNTEYRGPLLLHALRSAQPHVIVAHEQFVDRFEEVADEWDSRPLLVVVGAHEPPQRSRYPVVTADSFLARADPVLDLDGPNIWDIASIMYTSGTTGPSKGVIMPWGQMYEIATRVYPIDDFNENDCYYLPSVTYHMSAKGVAYTMALLKGRLVIRDRFSMKSFFADVARYRCTLANLLGAGAQLLYSADSHSDDAASPLRYVLMSPVLADVEGFMKRFDLVVTTGYGMTEIGPVIGGTVSNHNHRSCGRQMPGYQVRLVDEHDHEVPEGQVGELIVRSNEPWKLSQGYFGLPDESMKAWRNGWFHTGDAFRKDTKGDFYFVDRIKDSIRRRGENISSFEVESIVNSHTDIAESAAVAVPSELGEDDVKIVAVRKADSDLTEPALIEYLTPVMPRHMIPRYVEFVDALPKTPTDRIQKGALRAEGITHRTWDRDQAPIPESARQ